MESTLVHLVQYFEEYRQQLKSGSDEESMTGFVAFLNKKINFNQQPEEMGYATWKHFNRQTLLEMNAAYLGKIVRYVDNYSRKSMPKTALSSLDEFTYLIVLTNEKHITKSELIHRNGHPITTGTEIIKRLLKKGFLHQFEDEVDKRSVRVSITEKGLEALKSAEFTSKSIAQIATGTLTDEELVQLLGILQKLDQFHDQIYKESLSKDVEELVGKHL